MTHALLQARTRIKICGLTREADVDAALEVVPAVVAKLRALSPAGGPVLVG